MRSASFKIGDIFVLTNARCSFCSNVTSIDWKTWNWLENVLQLWNWLEMIETDWRLLFNFEADWKIEMIKFARQILYIKMKPNWNELKLNFKQMKRNATITEKKIIIVPHIFSVWYCAWIENIFFFKNDNICWIEKIIRSKPKWLLNWAGNDWELKN